MNFISVQEVFPGIAFNLRVLSRGTERYRLALYQHEGVLALTEQNTKLGNRDNPSGKLRSFFNKARESNADLAITPEYSCPWEVIRNILDDPQHWPNDGKLWAIGAESITPDEITAFAAQYNHKSIKVHFDGTRLAENGVFFDPLVYLFRAEVNDVLHLIVLIQFKTQHMGVWAGGDIERDRLKTGREVYIIRNNADSVNLMTMICSEAMNLPQAMDAGQCAAIGWHDRPFLILNPQVNPNPVHEKFIEFRKFVFEQERKEIIGLNWNLFSRIGNQTLLLGGSSRSGIYMSSPDVNFGDKSRMRSNHKLGMYYFYFGKTKHAFILNSKPHVYVIDQLSVHITEGVPPQRMRNGPELIESSSFQLGDDLIENNSVSDYHLDCLVDLHCTNQFLTNADSCVLEKERLVCLSSYVFLQKTYEGWSGVDKLYSVRLLEATEINNRISYTEDVGVESQRQRQLYITAINELDGVILPDKGCYPESIADLKAYPVFLGYSQDTYAPKSKHIEREKYRYNLVNQTGSMIKATVCYLGLASLRQATEAFENIQSMFELDSMNRQRVVIFYKEGIQPAVIFDKLACRIVIADEKGLTSYLG